MKSIKIESAIVAFLAILPSMALASIILFGSVFAQITLPNYMNIGGMKVNEQKTINLFYVNTSVTENINMTTACNNPGTISGVIKLPTGSTYTENVIWNQAALTILPANISTGWVTFTPRGEKQGSYNCTLTLVGGGNLNISYVNSW